MADVTVCAPYQYVVQRGDYYGFDLAEPESRHKAKKRGAEFVGSYTCKVTKETFEIRASVESAATRGLQHFVGNWEDMLDDLDRFPKKAKVAAMKHVKAKLVRQAHRECRLEIESKAAEQKAKDTLCACLKPDQLKQFKKDETFTVEVPNAPKGFPSGTFRISKGSAFNVKHIESKEMFCVVARESVPVYDQMLTQKLLLENEPKRFFKTANRAGGPRENTMRSMLESRLRFMEGQLMHRLLR